MVKYYCDVCSKEQQTKLYKYSRLGRFSTGGDHIITDDVCKDCYSKIHQAAEDKLKELKSGKEENI
jgi:hypothetical protein